MVFTTAGGGASQLYPYEIDNSLRFNDGDSARLSKSLGASPGGSNTNATFSFWIKRGVLENQQILFNSYVNDLNYFRINLRAHDAGTAPFGIEILDIASGLENGSRLSNQGFKDVAAWYHIFVTTDSDNGTNEDRVKVYINNERITSWASSANWGSTFKHFADNATLYVGTREGTSQFYDGYFAEFHAVDGQELAPTDFGETNDNGVWIPKEYEGTYGTNGFYLKFADSSDGGVDSSGNGNNFTATNLTAQDNTTDTPTNNFCTFNPLTATGGTYSEGNTVITTGSNASRNERGTFGIDNGKWYWEYKLAGSSIDNIYLGIGTTDTSIGAEQTGTYTYYSAGSTGRIYTGGSIVATPTAFAVGDIVSIGYNADDNQVLFYLNGSLVHTTSSVTDITYNPFARIFYTTSQVEANFGNAPFSISSGNSDANGYGNFEYAVPSGYYALCTKNLATYG